VSSQAPTQLYLETARRLAQEAGALVLGMHQSASVKSHKSDHSPVTEADLQSDEWIRRGLAQAFPEHAILTEEDGLSGNVKSDWVWMIDPLDGTKAFAKRIPGFCVMVGLTYRGQPQLGVVVDPIEGLTYEALRGEGAFLWKDGKRQALKVSQRSDYPQMPLVVSTGFPDAALHELQSELGVPTLPPINSVGIKVGLLVRQIGDIYLNHHGVHYWDTCAPQIILEEAGGRFTKLDGTPLSYALQAPYSHQARTLASNGKRHDDLLKVVSGISLGIGS